MMQDAAVTRQPLGQMLLAEGAVTPERLEAALDAQRETTARLGEILAARGWTERGALARVLARQSGLHRVDLTHVPPEPNLADPASLPLYLRHRLIPWRAVSGDIRFVTDDAALGRRGLALLGLPDAELVLTDPRQLDQALLDAFGPALAARASARVPVALSARSPTPLRQWLGIGIALGGTLALDLVAAAAWGAGIFLLLVLINAMNAVVRIAVLSAALRRPRDLLGPQSESPMAREADGAVTLAARRQRPVISLLIPLLREPEVLPVLLESLDRLDWPRELLDVILILEQGDETTEREAERLGLPPWVRVLVVPPGGPRTKPRALNVALDFARGSVIGIYDAEDRPEPDQLRRVAAILRDSPPEVACVQCRLSYYNSRENWLTRCFTIEYMMWFDVLITGFQDLGLPVPLGGTSVFFRRGVLEDLGGWDAHNVTEDADLGMRLARAGYRCAVSASTTHEEANSRLGPWVRQRSRWLKGYMNTWLVHMRDPADLWRGLGTVGFLGFQTLFLGAAVAYLGLPLFWIFWGVVLLGEAPAWLGEIPLWLIVGVGLVQLAGWLAMLLAAMIATARRGQRWLQPWVLTLGVYWPIGAVAAYLGLAEMLFARSYWRKTRHGVGRLAAAERTAALDRHAALRAGVERIAAAE